MTDFSHVQGVPDWRGHLSNTGLQTFLAGDLISCSLTWLLSWIKAGDMLHNMVKGLWK